MLKRQIRRARLERDAAVEAVEGFRKKERLHALRERQAELALARVAELEASHARQGRVLSAKGRDLLEMQASLRAAEASCERRALCMLRMQGVRGALCMHECTQPPPLRRSASAPRTMDGRARLCALAGLCR
jgi:hypothetical protein